MKQSNPVVALAAIFAVSVAGCGSNDNALELESTANAATADAETAQVSDVVSFELGDMDGALRQSAEWDGQPKLLNFWATWCAPCRREIPLLKDAQESYGASLDMQIIGIAIDNLPDVVAYAEQAEFNYPILVGEQDAMDVAESSGIDFIGLPFTMVLSPSGELIKTHIGEIKDEHIVEIADVFAQMRRGELDLRGARAALGSI